MQIDIDSEQLSRLLEIGMASRKVLSVAVEQPTRELGPGDAEFSFNDPYRQIRPHGPLCVEIEFTDEQLQPSPTSQQA